MRAVLPEFKCALEGVAACLLCPVSVPLKVYKVKILRFEFALTFQFFIPDPAPRWKVIIC